ncbi:glycosyltransferase [Luteolibacter sp. Populi]|uniref:glycosyltransferase n=1 Tax=Luteolibacter sp. Populi TaxID=3230487 RepID=UPI00346705F1
MNKLRICLVSPPYQGHLNPLLGIGRELRDLAEITVLSTPGAMPAIAAAGFKGYPIMAEGEAVVNWIATPGKTVKNNPLLMFQQFKKNMALQPGLLRELEAAFAREQPDIVIADFTLPVTAVAAQRNGARWWSHLPSACVFETPDAPPAYFGGLKPGRGRHGRCRDHLLRAFTRFFKRGFFFLFRDTFRQLGLSSVYRPDGSERAYSAEKILVSSVRELEFARRYPQHLHFIGPLPYTPPSTAAAPEFISDKKHLLVTLGTHSRHHKDGMAALLQQAAGKLGDWVVHFSNGEPGSTKTGKQGNFHRHDFISYADHLHRYDLVLHHAGSGIMLQCLRLGIPAVVFPLDFDQFDNAARLEAAGLAIWVRQRESLEGSLIEAIRSDDLACACRAFSKVIAAYDPGTTLRSLITNHSALCQVKPPPGTPPLPCHSGSQSGASLLSGP